MGPKTKRRVLIRLMQFFVLGVLFGIAEDLIAIHLATEAEITWDVIKVAFLVAVPFAIISEILVDLRVFRRLLNHSQNKRRKN